MRRLLLVIIIVISLFLVAGCVKETPPEAKELPPNTGEEPPVEEPVEEPIETPPMPPDPEPEEQTCSEAGEYAEADDPGVELLPCCDGLAELDDCVVYDSVADDCVLMDGCGIICSDCGDGVCDAWENWCVCPEDCGQ